MRFFSSIKRFFGVGPCQCCEAKTYSQKEVDNLSQYWLDLVKKARLEERKECEKALLITQPAEVKKKKAANGQGSALDYEKIKARTVKRRSKIKPIYKSKDFQYVRPFGKDTHTLYADMKKSIVDFTYNCCEWVDNKIESDKFMGVYLWWCKEKGIIGYTAKAGVGKHLRNTGVKTCSIEKKYVKQLYYLGIKIRPDVMQRYLDSKKKPQLTHCVKAGPAVNVMKASQDGELFSV